MSGIHPAGSSGVIPLDTFDNFLRHPEVEAVASSYTRRSLLAEGAVKRLKADLEDLSISHARRNGRTLCSSIEVRVKSRESWLRKLYQRVCEKSKNSGVSSKLLSSESEQIYDLAGARYATPYFDEVKAHAINHIKPHLKQLGYGVEPSNGIPEGRDYLEQGDAYGYRSFHFYVIVPVPVDIYGATDCMLCEMQGRSELQHIWAVKSHDLLYKAPGLGKDMKDIFQDDMRHISDGLRVADHHFVKIKDALSSMKKGRSANE